MYLVASGAAARRCDPRGCGCGGRRIPELVTPGSGGGCCGGGRMEQGVRRCRLEVVVRMVRRPAGCAALERYWYHSRFDLYVSHSHVNKGNQQFRKKTCLESRTW